MADFLQKIAVDWSPAKQSTQDFVNSIIAEIQRIQRMPLTQQRSELSSGVQAITSRVETLGQQGVLDPRAVERTLAQTLAPIRTAQEGVSGSLVEVQAARRLEAQQVRLQATRELEQGGEYVGVRAENIATLKRLEQQARQEAAATLEADRDYIKSRAEEAASNRSIALKAKAAGLGLEQGAGEEATAFQARVVGAERLQADRQRLANAKHLSTISGEQVKLEAETSLLERQRQRALNAATQALVQQRIASGEVNAGTSFQQIQRALASRQGGTAKLPEEYQSLGQFVGSKLVTTAGFALSGAAAYGALSSLREIYSSERDIQDAFKIINGQLDALGQGGQLDNVRRDIAGIAADTGTAESAIAQTFPQIEGAFHDTRVALEDARAASEIAKITKTDLAATVQSLLPASIAFKTNFRSLGDEALGVQERSGVAASRTLQLFSAIGPVAAQAGLSLRQVSAIAAAVLQDTARTPQSVAEDLNRVIPQLQTRTPLIAAAYTQAGQKGTADQFVKDISAGKTGAAVELLITSYGKLTAAQQQAVESAAGTGRGTKDIIDLLLNEKVALGELNPALDNAGKTSKYFSDLQKDLGQQASQVKEELLQLGRSILESGAADALGDVLVAVALLVHGLGDLAGWFSTLNRASHGNVATLLEIAAAAKALQVVLASNRAKDVGGIILNKIPGLSRPDGAHYPGSQTGTPAGPEADFAAAVNEAGESFLATVEKASARLDAALSGGGRAAAGEMEGGAAAAAGELEGGGAAAAGELEVGGAIAARENVTGSTISNKNMLLGWQGILAAIAGYAAYKGTQWLLGSPDHPKAAGRFENRVLNDTVAPAAHFLSHFPGNSDLGELNFGKPYKDPLDSHAYDQAHAAISGLGAGLQQGAAGALSNDEERRIAEDLKAAKSKNIDVVLAAIHDLNKIYGDLKARDPHAAQAAKDAQTAAQAAAGNAAELTPDPTTGIAPLETDVDNALASYANGTNTLAGAIADAQQKLAGLPSADPRVRAARQKLSKVVSDAFLQDQQLADSLQDPGVEGQQSRIDREVALFDLPQFDDPGDRLSLAKQIVENLKAELTAEADAATSTQERNRILAEGLAIPPQVRQALGQQIVDTDPLLQQLLAAGNTLDKDIRDAVAKDTANLVAGGKAVGDAYVAALQEELLELNAALQVAGIFPGSANQILSDIEKVQGDLNAALASRSALNTQAGVPGKVTAPPKSHADELAHTEALNKANADLDSARAGNDKVKQAQIAGRVAQQDLDAARAAKDDVKIAQALAAKERASQQLGAALDEIALANDTLQAARDAGDPIAMARDAQKTANDQMAIANRTHDTVAAINAQAAQISSGQQMAAAMAELGQSQMNLVKAQLEASGDVIGASKEQVAIIQREIADYVKQHPTATLQNSAELNNLNAQLVSAQADVGKTTTSFAEQQIQDNLDLKRITTGQAVAQLRALEALQTTQHDRDEIEKKIRSLLGSTGDLKMNLPDDILPTLYEARRLNGVATGSSYQGGTVDNRTQTFVFDGSDLQAVQRVVAAEVGSGSSRYGTTPRRY
jgi:hypothetical protein